MSRFYSKTSSFLPAGLVALFGMVLWMLQSVSALSNEVIFSFLTIIMLAFLWAAVQPIRRTYPKNWLLNPLVLCALMTFTQSYGLTNVIYFASSETLAPLGIDPGVSAGMVKQMALVFLGAIAMVIGYDSPLAIKMTRPAIVTKFQANYLPKGELRSLSIPVMITISTLTQLMAIRMGVMGYSANYEGVIAAANYTMYFALMASLGKLALLLVGLNFYSPRSPGKMRFWLIFILAIQVIFGFISGLKSAVCIPFVILIVCQYMQTGKFSRMTVLILLAAIVTAYAVIEPFRYARNTDPDFNGSSIVSIVNTLIAPDISTKQIENDEDKPSVFLSFCARVNTTKSGVPGLVYADENPVLPPDSPEFLKDILMTPFYALVPRIIWQSKPVANLGIWYSQVVNGSDINSFSSFGMGPFTFLYFTGGFTAVFIGFYIIGIVQRTIFMLLQPGKSIPCSAVYLTCLPVLSTISEFPSIITLLCRELPLILLLMFVLFRRKHVTQTRAKFNNSTTTTK